MVRGEADVGLLLAVGPDEGVDLDGVDLVDLLDGVLDLPLVGLDVNDEDEGVVLLNLLNSGAKPQREGRTTVSSAAERETIPWGNDDRASGPDAPSWPTR